MSTAGFWRRWRKVRDGTAQHRLDALVPHLMTLDIGEPLVLPPLIDRPSPPSGLWS